MRQEPPPSALKSCADAKNHNAIAATWQTATIAIDAAFDVAPIDIAPSQPAEFGVRSWAA